MRITGIDVYHVAMTLLYPFRTAFGNDSVIETVLVRMQSEEGYGWGEASPWALPAYSPEYAGGVYKIVTELFAPRLLGQEIGTGEELQERLAWAKGNPFAKASLDTAWWDLEAKRRGQPLWQMIGGKQPIVDVGADFGIMESHDQLLAEIEAAAIAGYLRVKLKYRPGWDLEMIRTVRRHFPELTIHIDCNSAYTLDDIDMFRQVDELGLFMIEQPLMHDDLVDHATLQNALTTPICLDESITSPARARKAAEIGACRWINIKYPRVGGMTQAIAVHDMAASHGIPCWVGGMIESAVGANHCLALATLPNFTYPADIFPSSRFFDHDLGNPQLVHSAPSRISAQNAAGIGVEPDPERLRRQSIACRHLVAE